MTFLRNCALLLPASFLVSAFAFLLSHGRSDPALAVYPFLRDWLSPERLPGSPELQFLLQATVLFLPLYAIFLLLVGLVAAAERTLENRRQPDARSGRLRRVFGTLFLGAWLILSAAAGFLPAALRHRTPTAFELGPLLVAVTPFAAALAAVVPAMLLALPGAALARMQE